MLYRAKGLIASNSIFLGLAIITVLVRFVFRRKSSPRFGYDDSLILVALVSSIGLCLTNIIGVPLGHLGTDLDQLNSPEETEAFLKFTFAWQLLWLFAAASVKLSVLQFYRRTIHSPTFSRIRKVLVWTVVTWLVSFFWATLFQAFPVHCNWDASDPDCHAANAAAIYMMGSGTDLVLNSAILGMPWPMIQITRTSKSTKAALGFVFVFGLFCVVASIAKLVITNCARTGYHAYDPQDHFFDANNGSEAVQIMMWGGIEVCASVICACLPCFGQYVTKAPVLHDYGLDEAVMKPPTPVVASDLRYTGGSRDISRTRRLRTSGLTKIDTNFGTSGPRGRSMTEGSSIEQMIATLPSPLRTPKVSGKPTNRDRHEPEFELGRMHLRTGSEETVSTTRQERV